MKNHIVSQMIIKRFSKAINVYDLVNSRLDLSKKPAKVFYKVDRIAEEVDKLIGRTIETPFANLLYGKLNDENYVTLTRSELVLIKRYLLMTSVRGYDENEYVNEMKEFNKHCEKYISLHKELKFKKRTKELKISNREIYENCLRVYCENKDMIGIINDSRSTLEMICWASSYFDTYLSIWDAPKNMEFILSDSPFFSEYEGCHNLTGGLSLSKLSYLYYMANSSDENDEKYFYFDMLMKSQLLYENYSFFNISSKRCLVLINPFFKMYFGVKQFNPYKNITKEFGAPDMWPSVLQNKDLFSTPVNERKSSLPNIYLDDDLFFYQIKTLSPSELTYLNSLIIRYSKEIIGFNNPEAIAESIGFTIWLNANLGLNPSKYKNPIDLSKDFVGSLVNSRLLKLCDYCYKLLERKPEVQYIPLFEEIVNNMLKDFKTNKYIYYYFLEKEQETLNCDNLSFLDKDGGRILYIKKKYKKLWGKEWLSH